MHRSVLLVWLVVLVIIEPSRSSCISQPTIIQLYVVPFPSIFGVDGDGSFACPYSSLQRALDHIENDY